MCTSGLKEEQEKICYVKINCEISKNIYIKCNLRSYNLKKIRYVCGLNQTSKTSINLSQLYRIFIEIIHKFCVIGNTREKNSNSPLL